ncbi:hypothetical protein EVAR_45472_1 [Eumeta japonica]|uniref:Uncharacterized protein n=1 Tax=Eumeta variegata TaxID=151549 RepID=A0A4C1WDM5_EUMVA|nr:hypothetical protein EVAR_45472_1 [Eumeta japonica]
MRHATGPAESVGAGDRVGGVAKRALLGAGSPRHPSLRPSLRPRVVPGPCPGLFLATGYVTLVKPSPRIPFCSLSLTNRKEYFVPRE